jgi:HD-GYP domain-containing protein (c-di-GMP phosphodiesterase class II)
MVVDPEGVSPVRLRSWSVAIRVALVYVLFAVAWILLSDRAAAALSNGDAEVERELQSLKGLAFVLASGLVIYAVTRMYFRRAELAADRLGAAYDETLAGWAAALDIRDRSTARHTERVTDLTADLAERLGVTGDELVRVRRGATLHDIGKMGVADSILHKPGPLTPEEWEQMRRHPQLAVDMLSGVDYLRDCLAIPWCHHERWDGTGYPRGLAGTDIPVEARMFAVVDVYDAVTSERPYRRPMSRGEALALVREGSGTHFEPRIVEEFVAMMAPVPEQAHHRTAPGAPAEVRATGPDGVSSGLG